MTVRAGIVGTGWMAAVHTEALRRIGVEVVGMVGSSPERARAKANPLLPPAFDSLDDLPPIAEFIPDADVVEALERGLRAKPDDPADETGHDTPPAGDGEPAA